MLTSGVGRCEWDESWRCHQVLLYGSETMIQGEMERSRIRAVQMHSLIDLLGIRRVEIMPNVQIKDVQSDEGDGLEEFTKIFSDGWTIF